MPRARRDAETIPADDPLVDLDLAKDPETRSTRPRRSRAGAARTRTPTTRTTATAMRAAVQEELHIGLGLLAGMISVKDPCGEIFYEVVQVPTGKGVVELDRIEAIAQRTTNIIARYPKALKRLSEGGVLMDYLMLASLLWPVAVSVVAHHRPGGDRHEEREPEDLSIYAAHTAG